MGNKATVFPWNDKHVGHIYKGDWENVYLEYYDSIFKNLFK